VSALSGLCSSRRVGYALSLNCVNGERMDSRFTFKDFVFVVLFVVVLGAVAWVGWQFSYQEGRLNDLRTQMARLDDTQKQQLMVLQDIRKTLREGVAVTSGGTGAGTEPRTGRVRQKNPDGSQYVYF